VKHLKHLGNSFWKDDYEYIKDICKIATDEGIVVVTDIGRSQRKSRTKSIVYDLHIVMYRFSNTRRQRNHYDFIERYGTRNSAEFCTNAEFCDYAQNIVDRVRNLGLGLDIKVGFRNRRILKNEKSDPKNPTENIKDNVDYFQFTVYQTKQPKLFNKY